MLCCSQDCFVVLVRVVILLQSRSLYWHSVNKNCTILFVCVLSREIKAPLVEMGLMAPRAFRYVTLSAIFHRENALSVCREILTWCIVFMLLFNLRALRGLVS